MKSRSLFSAEHEEFRATVRRFIADKIVPYHAQWERDGRVPRQIWLDAGALGMLCCTVPEQYGGAGADFLYDVVVLEELALAHVPGPGFGIHSEMAVPYIVNFGTELQKQQFLPRLVSGEAIAAVAMTEPEAGSDLRAIRSRARRVDDSYVLSGQKVFISNGQLADVFVVAAKVEGSEHLSLFLVEADRKGFHRGRALDKIGGHAQDTSELFFDEVRLPTASLLGEEGKGFSYLRRGLARERLTICINCQARAEATFRDTVAYVSDRRVFGKVLSDMQNTRFSLATVRADLAAGRSFVDNLLVAYLDGELSEATAAMGKLWLTEMLGRSVDTCIQFHGGWGYMREYAVGRAYVDARVERIAGGASEIMREIIARDIWAKDNR